MTVSLTYDPVLSRVRIDATGLAAADLALVERSTDQIRWNTVRGGAAVPVAAGVMSTLDDYEFVDAVPNFYRVHGYSSTPISLVGPGATVSDANASGTATLSPAFPPGIAAGDLLILHASIRNSAGSVDTPAGWTPMLTLGRVSVIGRIYDGVFSAPTVSFSGGVANATIIARISAWRNAHLTPLASTTLINAVSQQNIPHPGLTVTKDNALILAGCWKLDAWASVDPLPGFSEAQDSPVTLGDDASQGLDYQIQTTKANIPSGEFVVTGGSAQVSRSFVMAVERPLLNEQSASITPTLDGVWLKSIARPFLNRQVTVADFGDVERSARAGVFDVVGRSLPVAVSDVRGSRRWTLDVLTQTLAEASDVDLVLASGDPLFVHVPADCPVPGGYVTVGDTTQRRTGRTSVRRLHSLPLTEVAAPGPDVVGATVNWQTVLNTYATWSDVLAAHATWADMLELIGSPTDVIVP